NVMQNGRFPAFEQADGQMQPGMLAAIRIEEGADGRFEAAGKTERGTHLDMPPELAGHKWHTEQGCRRIQSRRMSGSGRIRRERFASAAAPLHVIQRLVRMVEQRVAVLAVFRVKADADAD